MYYSEIPTTKNNRMQKPYAPKMLGGQPNSGNASILGAYGPPTHPLLTLLQKENHN